MKYTNKIVINQSLGRTIELMDNAENMKKWMPNLLRYDVVSGKPGELGTKMDMYFKRGKGEMKMTETITHRNFPHEFDAVYEAKGVWNKQVNRFRAVDANTTEWVSETEFRFSGFMKIIAFFMGKSAFQKESAKIMDKFKTFAESAQ